MPLLALLLATRLFTAAADEQHAPAHTTWFVPQTHSARHVYGAPIQPKILGRAQRNAHGRAAGYAGYSAHTNGHSKPVAHHARLARDSR